MANKVKVLFVCLGNICRSPTAHGVFRKLVIDQGLTDRIEIDSAGTGAWHIGKAPDSRAQATARNRGIDMSDLRARQVDSGDFMVYDYVLAMDESNLSNLKAMVLDSSNTQPKLFMDYAPARSEREVPDPYYGGDEGFEHVFDMVEDACFGLLEDIRANHL